ncbi:unnamed protein product [Vitrella brassicaformis CCMP3155]|uniref:Uncharacterized protein n=1 Tax=Vitrella brassicaformis (strain CCMP3155) TaxID=1169540 RepID=A0A0G4FAA7_VITBC|nr:unnamed protein product [Vitrella brassicaformis CCMP3155]|eukprot:CEM09913.1 unnamed protein product [Vitrella brassicaformis CCMP3155]
MQAHASPMSATAAAAASASEASAQATSAAAAAAAAAVGSAPLAQQPPADAPSRTHDSRPHSVGCRLISRPDGVALSIAAAASSAASGAAPAVEQTTPGMVLAGLLGSQEHQPQLQIEEGTVDRPVSGLTHLPVSSPPLPAAQPPSLHEAFPPPPPAASSAAASASVSPSASPSPAVAERARDVLPPAGGILAEDRDIGGPAAAAAAAWEGLSSGMDFLLEAADPPGDSLEAALYQMEHMIEGIIRCCGPPQMAKTHSR